MSGSPCRPRRGTPAWARRACLERPAERAAEAGFTYLRARATELERDFAYGNVRQLLEPVVAKPPGLERDRLFEGAVVLSKSPFVATGARHASSVTSRSMPHGLYWLLNNLAEKGPVVLALDHSIGPMRNCRDSSITSLPALTASGW